MKMAEQGVGQSGRQVCVCGKMHLSHRELSATARHVVYVDEQVRICELHQLMSSTRLNINSSTFPGSGMQISRTTHVYMNGAHLQTLHHCVPTGTRLTSAPYFRLEHLLL